MSIRKQYDTDLESLKNSLTEMGRNSADAVENALEALCVADAGFRAHRRHLLHAWDGYSSLLQSCRATATNAFQSSGGFPRPSIFSKTAYGSDLLPDDRSVVSSLTQA